MSKSKSGYQTTFQLRVRSKTKEAFSQREIQHLISKVLHEKGYDFLLWEMDSKQEKR